MNLSEKIINTIQKQKIAPAPKSIFVIKNYLFIFLFVVAVLFGGLVFSTDIFIIANQDWMLNTYLNSNRILFFFMILPYFWLIILTIFAGLSLYNFYQTKRGYKISTLLVITIYLITTLVVGIALYYFGIGAKIEEAAANKIPYYNQLNYARAVWSRHDSGLLAGKILDTSGEKIKIMDLDGEIWNLDISSSTGIDYIYKEKDIKIIGKKLDTNTFQAYQIKPWCGCGGCMNHQGESCLDHCRNKMQ